MSATVPAHPRGVRTPKCEVLELDTCLQLRTSSPMIALTKQEWASDAKSLQHSAPAEDQVLRNRHCRWAEFSDNVRPVSVTDGEAPESVAFQMFCLCKRVGKEEWAMKHKDA